MNERPIIMTPENGQKTNDGIKTQTRRLNGLHALNESPDTWIASGINGDGDLMFRDGAIPDDWHAWITIACPYGGVGDRLWIRENGWERPERMPQMLRDGADTWERFYFDVLLAPGEAEELKGYGFKRRPSIHMPRWACRTVLELTEIRVERVNQISGPDCLAEGIRRRSGVNDGVPLEGDIWAQEKKDFRVLWESINGPGSWDRNDWVWVLSFKKV